MRARTGRDESPCELCRSIGRRRRGDHRWSFIPDRQAPGRDDAHSHPYRSINVSLNLDDVTRIAKEAARAESESLIVAGVTLGGGADSEYVEVLVNVQGCSASPCQVSIGTFRDLTEVALRAEISRKLREHLDAHRT